MAVEQPKIESSTSLGFENVNVDNSARIGVGDSALTNIVGTMGSLVSGISQAQLNTISQLSANQAIVSTQSNSNLNQMKYWLIAAGAILLVVLLKAKRKR